jgi:hypothetical protein
MQRCSIWTVSLAAALSLTGAAWAEHEGGGGHGPAAGHGTTPTFAKQRGSDEGQEARESHSGAKTSPAAGANSASRLMNRLMNDPTLSARLLTLMPTGSTKMDLMNAAKGFRNLGQFIAALHAAKDLNIPFGFGTTAAPGTLKAEMTGSDHDSLGQAIHELNSKLDAQQVKDEVTNAQTAAKADLKSDRAAKEAAEDAKDKTEDAKEKTAEKHEDAKEKAEEANEGVKNFAVRLAARLMNDPTLATTLSGLGVTNANVMAAAMGFRNLNQFLAALHAANDLNIPNQSAMQTFDQLKAEMTGSDHDSLAQAIHDVNSKLTAQQVKDEVTKARNEARADLKMDRAAEEAAEDAAEDAKEATKEAAEEANEAAKAPAAGTTTTGTSTTKP